MGELQTGFDRDTASAEADVPEDASIRQVECLKCQQADGHLCNHLFSSVEQGELNVRNPKTFLTKGTIPIVRKNHAVGHGEVTMGSLFKRQGSDLFEFRIAQVLTHMHLIVGVAVVYHALGNGSRGVLLIRQNADLCSLSVRMPIFEARSISALSNSGQGRPVSETMRISW